MRSTVRQSTRNSGAGARTGTAFWAWQSVDLRAGKRSSRKDEIDLVFAGFLLFLDPPKEGVKETLAELAHRGIAVKVISGDNRYVAAHLAQAVGLRADRIMTGEELSKLTKSALFARVQHTDLFVEIDPNQKERIVRHCGAGAMSSVILATASMMRPPCMRRT